MRFCTWFDGVGCFRLALIRAGFSCVASCEIEDFPRRVLEARFGSLPTFGDINAVKPEDIPASELWIGGFPCQDVSSAGKRSGIASGVTRSGLLWTLLDLWDRVPADRAPEWLLLENVPGLLSGRNAVEADEPADGSEEEWSLGQPAGDSAWMGIVLGALADRGLRFAWRCLDAQFWGVAQRRKRIFFLARRSRDGPHPAEVLLEPESRRRDPPTRGKAGARTAGGAEGGAGESRGVVNALDSRRGGADDNEAQAGHLIAQTFQNTGAGWWNQSDVGAAVRTPAGSGSLEANLVASSIAASAGHHGHSSPRGDGSDNLVVGTGAPNGSLAATGQPMVAYSIHADAGRSGEAKTPSADAEGKVRLRDPGLGLSEDASFALNATAPHAVAYPIDSRQVARGEKNTNDRSDEAASGGAPGTGVGEAGDPSYTVSERGQAVAYLDSWSMHNSGSPNQSPVKTAPAMAVRRLLPVECEKLQGLPPGWTDIPGATDSSRYKAIGNGGAVPVVEWIGRRLLNAMDR